MPKRPRRILPNVSYLITRRVRERAFRLRPEPWLRRLFEYAVGRAAQESGVQVIGFGTMCNHFHAVVHDPKAAVPKLTKRLDELLGRAINAQQGRRDSLWEQGGPSYVPLLSREALEDALVYSIVNPVAAGLVAGVSAWPGFVTLPEMLGNEWVVPRPALTFFGKRTVLPLEVTLRLFVPPTHSEMSAAEFRAYIGKRVKAREEEIRLERKRRGAGEVLGMTRVLAFELDHRPDTPEPRRRRAPTAKVGKCHDAVARLAAHQEAEDSFLAAYRAALEAFREGLPCLFPRGTYRLRVDYKVACEPFI